MNGFEFTLSLSKFEVLVDASKQCILAIYPSIISSGPNRLLTGQIAILKISDTYLDITDSDRDHLHVLHLGHYHHYALCWIHNQVGSIVLAPFIASKAVNTLLMLPNSIYANPLGC